MVAFGRSTSRPNDFCFLEMMLGKLNREEFIQEVGFLNMSFYLYLVKSKVNFVNIDILFSCGTWRLPTCLLLVELMNFQYGR